MPTPRYRVLATGIDGPEGVAWDGDRTLYAGSQNGLLHAVDVENGERRVVSDLNGRLLGIAMGADGSVVVCNQDQRCVQRVSIDSGDISTLTRGTAEVPMTTPNFAAADADGGLFISDSGTWGEPDGRIYHWRSDGSVDLFTRGLNFANGLALGADGLRLYVIESAAATVSHYDTSLRGHANSYPVPVWSAPAGSVPDGLSICADGGVIVSFFRPNLLVRLLAGFVSTIDSDDTGALRSPTNSAFFGRSMDRLCVANLGGDDLVEVTGTGLVGVAPFRVAFDGGGRR